MTIEIDDKELKLFKLLKEYIENKGYLFNLEYSSTSKYYNIFRKKENKWFKFNVKITYTVYVYNDWIYVEIDKKYEEEIKKLFKDFDKNINIKIKIVR